MRPGSVVSGGVGECFEPVQGGGELGGPGPAGLEVQAGAAGMEGEPGGDVQQPVSEAFGFGVGELAGEQQTLGPADDVVGEADNLKPRAVVLEVAERQVAQSGVLVVADVVLDACAAAVITLDRGGIAGLVGENGLEAVPVVVAKGQLRAGVRALAADQDPRTGRPPR